MGSYSCLPLGLEHPCGKRAVTLETDPILVVGSGRLVLKVSSAAATLKSLRDIYFGAFRLVQASCQACPSQGRQRVSFLIRIKPPCCAEKILYVARKGALTDSSKAIIGQ